MNRKVWKALGMAALTFMAVNIFSGVVLYTVKITGLLDVLPFQITFIVFSLILGLAVPVACSILVFRRVRQGRVQNIGTKATLLVLAIILLAILQMVMKDFSVGAYPTWIF